MQCDRCGDQLSEATVWIDPEARQYAVMCDGCTLAVSASGKLDINITPGSRDTTAHIKLARSGNRQGAAIAHNRILAGLWINPDSGLRKLRLCAMAAPWRFPLLASLICAVVSLLPGVMLRVSGWLSRTTGVRVSLLVYAPVRGMPNRVHRPSRVGYFGTVLRILP